MKMKTMRRLKKTIAPRRVHADEPGSAGRGSSAGWQCGVVDITSEPDPGPAPESIFDRTTGPFSHHRAIAMPGAADEET